MDSFFLSQQYEFVQRITEQMLAASEQDNWERVLELEGKRAHMLNELSAEPVQLALKKIDSTFANKIRECIQTILQANVVLTERAEHEKIQAQKGLHTSHVSAQLNRAYSNGL